MEKIKFEKLTFDKDTLTIIDCEKDAVEVFIPAKIENLPIMNIAENAFKNCVDLKKVIFDEIENEIEFSHFNGIGDYAFSYCSSLTEISIPYYMKWIGRGAFYGCKSLEKVSFSKGSFISSFAFAKCTNLKEVSLVDNVFEGAFSYCENLAAFPLSNEVDDISEYAFEHCNSLIEITIPKSVKNIEKLAFRSCTNLKKVNFEDVNNWYVQYRYVDEIRKIDVTNPEKNAQWLSRMDFDDGVDRWFKKN